MENGFSVVDPLVEMGCRSGGLITESYPETMNPYRIIPLITESYPYTKI